MGGRLDTSCIRPPPGRMRGKISGNMNRHIPGRSSAGGIPAGRGGSIGRSGRAITPLEILPPDFGARQFCRLSGKHQYRRHSGHAADHQAEENILRVLGFHRALLEKMVCFGFVTDPIRYEPRRRRKMPACLRSDSVRVKNTAHLRKMPSNFCRKAEKESGR
jgi:hypothetical protein